MTDIPVHERSDVPCLLCVHPAVGRYETPEGCVARPDVKVQDLCAQHVSKAGMIGEDVRLILIYQPWFYEQ